MNEKLLTTSDANDSVISTVSNTSNFFNLSNMSILVRIMNKKCYTSRKIFIDDNTNNEAYNALLNVSLEVVDKKNFMKIKF